MLLQIPGLRLFHLLRLLLVLLGISASLPSARAEEFLPPNQAFALTARWLDAHTLRLHWAIAPGYKLYRARIGVESGEPQATVLGAWQLPPGKPSFDPNFNETMEVYAGALAVDLPLERLGGPQGSVQVRWQGCAEAGLCYSPAQAVVRLHVGEGPGTPGTALVELPPDDAAAPPAAEKQAAANPPPPAPTSTQADTSAIGQALASGHWLQTWAAFWLAGVLLSFTPCVLPMLPILSSLIAGQSGDAPSRARGIALAGAYTLGMALVYAALGVAAGLAGQGLAAALQNAWVLGAFALVLVAMALSMFGVYPLQLPSGWQSLAGGWSNRLPGGSLLGVFLMGGLSALVVGPCVAAPLAGALVYISQTRDAWLGGTALFAMALGMGVPLMVAGASASRWLPRAGAWMERVKQLFGMLLLAVAVWIVSPVVPAAVQMLLWSAWLLAGAAFLGLFGPRDASAPGAGVATRAAGVACMALSTVLLVGAASGGQSVLQPLAHLRPTGSAQGAATPGLVFERISNERELEAVLSQARAARQPVMLDFYADWCASCKELEQFTFSKPEVGQRLRPVRLVQADVTTNSRDHQALLRRFQLFGPPGIVFLGPDAGVRHKVIGFQSAPEFLASIDTALQATP